jgi:hypothetical protein
MIERREAFDLNLRLFDLLLASKDRNHANQYDVPGIGCSRVGGLIGLFQRQRE